MHVNRGEPPRGAPKVAGHARVLMVPNWPWGLPGCRVYLGPIRNAPLLLDSPLLMPLQCMPNHMTRVAVA